MPTPPLKVAMLVNMIAPARIPVYSVLAAQFDLLLLHGGTESNRDSWRDLDKTLPHARVVQAWGWQIPTTRREKGHAFDKQYLHVTPGYIWHLLRFRPHALISNEMGLRTLVALAYGTIFRRPVWVWWGGTVHTERKIGFARRCLRKCISRWTHRWISYGQSSTEYLLSLGIHRDRVLQIQNAVDEHRFTQNVEPRFQIQPRPVLLYVGQLIARKGVDLLLNAAATLQKQGREFSLLLVGSGPDKQILEQRSKDLQLNHVHFRTSVPPDQMPSVYRCGDALVFPTLEDPWGLVVNEAMLSGLPVLCSRYAGCAEELLGPENSFDPEDADEFVHKLGYAATGQLSRPDNSRLKSTNEIVQALIRDLESIAPKPSRRLHAASTKLPLPR
jgi:glycosyltransferase involved in cell wall biosynthesis